MSTSILTAASGERSKRLDPEAAGNLVSMRRHLHSNPELSNAEGETQAYLLEQITRIGIDNARVAAGTGIVVDIEGRQRPSNRCILVRADIDALPIHEDTGLEFSSKNPGVMHACGHDAHTAMAFAAMHSLHRIRDSFAGTVRFVFQPAEEAEPLGGRRMVEEGWLNGVEAALGIHVDPYVETGKIVVGKGAFTLASDIFDITVKGEASHAAKPHEGVDALGIGCSIVRELNQITAREAGPFQSVVLSVTRFEAGHSYNVLAETATISGTLRTGDEALRTRGLRRVKEIAEGIAATHGARAEVRIVRGEPPVVNDAGMVRIVGEAVTSCFGKSALVVGSGWEAADDFGFYSERVPSAYFRLGVRPAGSSHAYPLHHPKMDVDETALPIGATALLASALQALEQAGSAGELQTPVSVLTAARIR